MVVGISLHVKFIIMVCNVYTVYSVLQQCIYTCKHLLSWCLIAVIASLVILHMFRIVLFGIDRFLIFMDASERSMSLLLTNFELATTKQIDAGRYLDEENSAMDGYLSTAKRECCLRIATQAASCSSAASAFLISSISAASMAAVAACNSFSRGVKVFFGSRDLTSHLDHCRMSNLRVPKNKCIPY